MQQFLRFGETRGIAYEIMLRDYQEQQERHLLPLPRTSEQIDFKKMLDFTNAAHLFDISTPAKLSDVQFPLRAFPGFPQLPKMAAQLPAQLLKAQEKERGSGGKSNAGSPLRSLQTMRPFDTNHNDKNALLKNSSATPSAVERKPAHLPSKEVPRDASGALDFSNKELVMQQTKQDNQPPPPPPKNPSPAPSSVPSQVLGFNESRKTSGASTPRRTYSPTPGYGGTLVSPSGKKRVLCTACQKTFCDKGALKIHYSAVHLKEMHKCTVDGCNMMFSSRRSRNRHSANPNPKLHMPQSRRKVPDGGVVENGKSLAGGEAPLPIFSGSTTPLAMPPIEIKPLMGMPRVGDLAAKHASSSSAFNLASVFRAKNLHSDLEPGEKRNCSEMEEKLEERSSSKKRKSIVPTRITQRAAPEEEDDVDDDVYGDAMSDESMEGICIEAPEVDDNTTVTSAPTSPVAGDDTPPNSRSEHNNGSHSPAAAEGAHSSPPSSPPAQPRQEVLSVFPKIDTRIVGVDGAYEKPLDFTRKTKTDVDVTGSERRTNASVSMEMGEDSSSEVDECDWAGDPDAPKQCSRCQLDFENLFALRAHVESVHLQRAHVCTVDGCNAAFPSRQSRDRHSCNATFHRKLLSTSASPASPDDVTASKSCPEAHQSEVTKQTHAGNGRDVSRDQSPDFERSSCGEGSRLSPAAFANILSPLDQPQPDPQGDAQCHTCQLRFRDNLALKEHVEKAHPREIFHCSVTGCDKIFSTRKSRNRHSQNDNLHRHLYAPLLQPVTTA